jgi:DNA repair photolyase
MINPFWGEFLVSPIPLEMNMNYCSHKCGYCFANLNKPDRTMDVKSTSRLLAHYWERDTYTAKLLKAGYPVLISNVSDPFANSNYRQSVPLMDTMSEMGIPIAIQTKGGRGIGDCLKFLPISTWYISISTWDEQVRERIEPGAPPIHERIRLIYDLVDRGHEVVVGINPAVPEWLPDDHISELLGSIQDAGASGVWVERLHLNANQEKQLSEREVRYLTPGLIKRAKSKQTPTPDMDLFCSIRSVAEVIGLEVYSVGQPNRSGFFKPFHWTYDHTFPTAQDFVNHCHSVLSPGSIISFDLFADFFEPLLPGGRLTIDSYLGAVAHNLWWTEKVPPQMTFRELLAWIWRSDKIKYNPARHPCFAFAGEQVRSGEWEVWTDNNKMPYMVFDPHGTNSKFCEVEDEYS